MINQKAFTLVEIIVTGIIIAILTAIALPNFINMTNRAYAQDAMRNLMTIYAAQQSYYQDHNAVYRTCSDPDLTTCINISTGLNLNIVNNGGTSYTCDAAVSPPICTATQTGVFTMTVTLTSPISTQPSAKFCNGAAINPCCSGGTAGAVCP